MSSSSIPQNQNIQYLDSHKRNQKKKKKKKKKKVSLLSSNRKSSRVCLNISWLTAVSDKSRLNWGNKGR